MSLIETRERFSRDILERRFIRKVLQDVSKDIDTAQRSFMSSRGFENQDWYNERGFKVTENEMGYTHLKKHRFVDMKTRMSKKGRKRKKQYAIHNKILWGHYNNVVKELHFGFTHAVQEEMRRLKD